MEYEIVTASDPDELVQEVWDAIREGWRPQGGIATMVWETGAACYQAMIRGE